MTSEQSAAQRLEAKSLNNQPCICPNCGGPAHFMGLDFKAPKMSDIKAWREAEAFIRSGKIHDRGVCSRS